MLTMHARSGPAPTGGISNQRSWGVGGLLATVVTFITVLARVIALDHRDDRHHARARLQSLCSVSLLPPSHPTSPARRAARPCRAPPQMMMFTTIFARDQSRPSDGADQPGLREGHDAVEVDEDQHRRHATPRERPQHTLRTRHGLVRAARALVAAPSLSPLVRCRRRRVEVRGAEGHAGMHQHHARGVAGGAKRTEGKRRWWAECDTCQPSAEGSGLARARWGVGAGGRAGPGRW